MGFDQGGVFAVGTLQVRFYDIALDQFALGSTQVGPVIVDISLPFTDLRLEIGIAKIGLLKSALWIEAEPLNFTQVWRYSSLPKLSRNS